MKKGAFSNLTRILIVLSFSGCSSLDSDIESELSTLPVPEYELLQRHLFKDSTELQVLTIESDDWEGCHSCSAPVFLRRSYRSTDGTVSWKEAKIDVNNQWGNIGHFYMDELTQCPDLLFFQGGYAQQGNSYTWINAFRLDESFLGRKEWSFNFKNGSDKYIMDELDSLAKLELFTSESLTPVEAHVLMDGSMDIVVEKELLKVTTTQDEYVAVYIKEDERTVKFNHRTKSMSLYYKLEYGNVYLDSVSQSNK